MNVIGIQIHHGANKRDNRPEPRAIFEQLARPPLD
jgi:hypothetical protein